MTCTAPTRAGEFHSSSSAHACHWRVLWSAPTRAISDPVLAARVVRIEL